MCFRFCRHRFFHRLQWVHILRPSIFSVFYDLMFQSQRKVLHYLKTYFAFYTSLIEVYRKCELMFRRNSENVLTFFLLKTLRWKYVLLFMVYSLWLSLYYIYDQMSLMFSFVFIGVLTAKKCMKRRKISP